MLNSQKDSFDVEITTLGNGGNGIGILPSGRKVFIPYCLPGEIIRTKIILEKKEYCYGEVIEILRPSPERIIPKCWHFGSCGGCHYQHIVYESQLKYKVQILTEQLRRLAQVETLPIEPIIPSLRIWHYRNHIQFHPTELGKMAFLAPFSNKRIEIRECFLMQSPMDQLWQSLALEEESGIDRVSWRVNEEQAALLFLEGQHSEPPEFYIDYPLNVVYANPDQMTLLSGDSSLVYSIKDADFLVSVGSFFQVNTVMISPLVDYLLNVIQPKTTDTIMDIYCGVGLFSKFFAPYSKQIIGVEISESAVSDFVINLDEFENVEIYLGAAEQIIPNLNIKSEVILVDPPRNGLTNDVLKKIIQIAPNLLVYVSCDLSSLARDMRKIISAGYQIVSIRPFDMFPQTFHLETVCVFHKPK